MRSKLMAVVLGAALAAWISGCATVQQASGGYLDVPTAAMGAVLQQWAESAQVPVVSHRYSVLDGELLFKTGQGSTVAIRYTPSINGKTWLAVATAKGPYVRDDYLQGIWSLVVEAAKKSAVPQPVP